MCGGNVVVDAGTDATTDVVVSDSADASLTCGDADTIDCGFYQCPTTSFCLRLPPGPHVSGVGGWYCQGDQGCHSCDCLADVWASSLICGFPSQTTCQPVQCGFFVVQNDC
jgi:hypothetical protein